MAQKADVVIYAISTNNSGMEKDGDKVLRYFTRETGGLSLLPLQGAGPEPEFREYRKRASASVQRCSIAPNPPKPTAFSIKSTYE